MSFRLRTHDINPPGNYPYEQTTGIYHNFAAVPSIESQARAVAQFRRGNNLPRSSDAEALEDVDAYQCQRLGNMGMWCVENTPNAPRTVAATHAISGSGGCRGCGAAVH